MTIISTVDAKAYLRTELGATEDSVIATYCASVDSLLNEACQREFVVASSGSARTYEPDGSAVLRIHDCTTVTSVVENGTTVAVTTGYKKEPSNALLWSGSARPYDQLRRIGGNWHTYPADPGTVVVTATWGWLAIPSAITEAAFILLKDVCAHRDVKFGLVGVADFGGVRARMPELVGTLIRPFRRVESFGIA